jgi:hypothetical protein
MASTYLSRTLGTPTDENRWTYSFWTKISKTGDYSWFLQTGTNASNNVDAIHIDGANSTIRAYGYPGSQVWELITNAKYRDPSAWYHIVIAYNSDEATSSNRAKMWVNGVQQTSFSTEIYPSLSANSGHINKSGSVYYIGSNINTNDFSEMLMTHLHFIDGTAYDASTFGETDATTGIWKPKTAPSVTYGTNGFFLKFENSGTMGLDSSPNTNNFTVNGTMTQTVDTPSNVFATFNPLIYMPNIPTFENGNLYVKGHDANYCEAISTLSMPKKGKWYAEFKKIEINNSFMVGIGNTNNIIEALRTNTNISESSGGYSGGAVTIRDAGDVRQTNASDISGFFPSSIANTNIIGIAIDLDNGAVYAHKNGTYGVISSVTGDPTSGASKTGAIDISGQAWYQNADFICFLFGNISSASKDWCQANFGNGYFSTTAVSSAGSNGNGAIFEYDVPTGYYALNTKNLATYG